ncbi:hypothetical protein PoB_007633500 [Plakobranchus ocellatus]|uniref:Uncharacterized protein n=1 Tax=Plakobranchus ocellatus TaxID=259542 RepID=A0AAV4E0G4_9GAST|nr:hypothetical protein PoB_007633500 [Plakobranchus ocellatus]
MASKKPITIDEVYRQLLAEDQLTEDSSCSSDEPLEETSQINVDIDMEANQPPSVDQTLGAHNIGHAMMLTHSLPRPNSFGLSIYTARCRDRTPSV